MQDFELEEPVGIPVQVEEVKKMEKSESPCKSPHISQEASISWSTPFLCIQCRARITNEGILQI